MKTSHNRATIGMRIVIKRLLSFIQVLSIIGVIVLQYLSNKSMGVNRYLVYKKKVFHETYLSADLMKVYVIALILIIIVSMIFLNVRAKKGNKRSLLIKNIVLQGFNIAGLALLIFYSNIQFLAVDFILIAVVICIILQYLKIIITHFFPY